MASLTSWHNDDDEVDVDDYHYLNDDHDDDDIGDDGVDDADVDHYDDDRIALTTVSFVRRMICRVVLFTHIICSSSIPTRHKASIVSWYLLLLLQYSFVP